MPRFTQKFQCFMVEKFSMALPIGRIYLSQRGIDNTPILLFLQKRGDPFYICLIIVKLWYIEDIFNLNYTLRI